MASVAEVKRAVRGGPHFSLNPDTSQSRLNLHGHLGVKRIVSVLNICLQPGRTPAGPHLNHDCTPARPRLDSGWTAVGPRLNPGCTLVGPQLDPGWTPVAPWFNPGRTPARPWLDPGRTPVGLRQDPRPEGVRYPPGLWPHAEGHHFFAIFRGRWETYENI